MTFRNHMDPVPTATVKAKERSIQCAGCSSEWFEQVRISKIDSLVLATPGQSVPELGYSHVVLRCIKCNDIQELPINLSSAGINPLVESYNDLIDTLEKPNAKDKDAIQAKAK